MPGPQLEDGYMRIANEFWDQVMMRDFSKRQRSILDLILRLSWGCGKRAALIPKLRHFQLAGVRPNHIRVELEWLVKANVIAWDEGTMLFAINKRYSEWSVSLGRGYDEDELGALISLNLGFRNRNGTSRNGNFYLEPASQNRNNCAELTSRNGNSTSQNRNVNIGSLPELGSLDFPKQEVGEDVNPHDDGVSGFPKDSIKDNTLSVYLDDDTEVSADQDGDEFGKVVQAYHAHIGMIGPTEFESLQTWYKERDGPTASVLIEAILAYAEKRKEDSRTPFRYLEAIIRNWHNEGVTTVEEARLRRQPRLPRGGGRVGSGQRKRSLSDGKGAGKYAAAYGAS